MVTPNPPVHPREYPGLNERFYRAEPAEYLELRLWALVATVGDATPPLEVGFDDLRLGRNEIPSQLQRERYAALESTVLLHHAAEAMLRLYLAHSHRNPCPWLQLAKLRNFTEFKKRIAQLRTDLETPEVIADAAEVFTWTAVRDPFVGMPNEVWESHCAALRQLLQFSINVLLDEAPFYNAAKHGLALLAGPVAMSLDNTDGPILSIDGIALSVLEQREHDDHVRRWSTTTRWVHPPQSIAIVGVIVRAIESLWEAARGHYRQPSNPDKLWIMEEDKIAQLLAHHLKEGFNVTTMNEEVLHDEPDEPPPAFTRKRPSRS